MKISFQNNDINANIGNSSRVEGMARGTEKQSAITGFVRVDIGNGVVRGGFPAGDGEKIRNKKTLTELMQEAGAVSPAVEQNYRTVLSNNMSAEDYARASEEGFDYYSMDPEDVVTIQDRIKAEVAKGGTKVIGYNDDLTGEKLAAAIGSETLARSLEDSFAASDIPLTDENIADVKEAWDFASRLDRPTDADKAYLIDNELEADIWGLYLSENSGNSGESRYIEESVDLFSKAGEKLLSQVTGLLKESGFDGENLSDGVNKAQWLIDRGLPVTADNIDRLRRTEQISFPIDEETFSVAAAAAIEKGDKPRNAVLWDNGESLVSKAVRLEGFYFSEEAESVIRDRRHLEEIRLSMTAEVNIRLLESDYSIDTAPIEDFIEALKNAERDVAAGYFPAVKETDITPAYGNPARDDGDTKTEISRKDVSETRDTKHGVPVINSPDIRAEELVPLHRRNAEATEDQTEEQVRNYRLMNRTAKTVADIREVPAAVIGLYAGSGTGTTNPGDFGNRGLSLKETYEKASRSYETLMTAPRSDLGDSIRKAFANAGVLAGEIGIEATEENLRAIRILGYNSMEISPENVRNVSAADMMVRSVIEKMTPASVLGMIRDGINPLETSFAELGAYLDAQMSGGYESTAKSYSDFLYGLEMQDNITPEERESYIGIYRLIHQVEKADGAAVGTVISEQAVLSFENLLSAARSRRLKGVDVRINESFGTTEQILKAGNSITEQIGTAFKPERYAYEAEKLREAANVSRECVELLDKTGIPGTAENLIAMESLLEKDNDLYREMSRYDRAERRLKEASRELADSLGSDDFDEKYSLFTDEMTRMSEELTMSADSFLDVRAMALVHRQFGFAARINASGDALEDSDYIIPMEIGNEISKVRISFRNTGGTPSAGIGTSIGEEEIEAHFELSGNILEGYVVKSGKNEVKNLRAVVDIFTETLRGDSRFGAIKVADIPVVSKDHGGPNRVSTEREISRSKDAEAEKSDGSERNILLQVTKLFLQTLA